MISDEEQCDQCYSLREREKDVKSKVRGGLTQILGSLGRLTAQPRPLLQELRCC